MGVMLKYYIFNEHIPYFRKEKMYFIQRNHKGMV